MFWEPWNDQKKGEVSELLDVLFLLELPSKDFNFLPHVHDYQFQFIERNPLEPLPNHTRGGLFKILESTSPSPFDDLPNIRNGKRIWRVLSKARVGDVAEVEIARKGDNIRKAEEERMRAKERGDVMVFPFDILKGPRPCPGWPPHGGPDIIIPVKY